VLFDDGAMVSAMCTSVFEKIKHKLHNWGESQRRLRMANGNIVRAISKWTGTVWIENTKAQGTFEVFESGGSWGFLLGKPMLQTFAAVHNYTSDTIKIMDQAQMILIKNQMRDERMSQGEGEANLMLDEKQKKRKIEQRKKQNQEDDMKPSNVLMGQWRPTKLQMRQKEENKTREKIKGGKEPPAREVSTSSSLLKRTQPDTKAVIADINELVTQETQGEEEQLLGKIPELELRTSDTSIYTQQTDPLNPVRVKEIIWQVEFGKDLSIEEREELEQFVRENTDSFALALKEVIPIPGVTLNLNIPENTTFNL